jgi:hypothetical protein
MDYPLLHHDAVTDRDRLIEMDDRDSFYFILLNLI